MGIEIYTFESSSPIADLQNFTCIAWVDAMGVAISMMADNEDCSRRSLSLPHRDSSGFRGSASAADSPGCSIRESVQKKVDWPVGLGCTMS